MKKLFYLSIGSIMLIAMLAACSSNDEGGSKNIKVPNKGELTQTVYADKNAGESTVKFITTGIWTSSIVPTRGETPEWVSISPDSGGEGEHEITLTLDVNTTGKERSAKIIIWCDGSKIEIKITQKAKTEAGEVPTVTYKYYIKEIRHVHAFGAGDDEIETDKIIFTYNSEMQPTKIYLTGDEGYKEETIISYKTNEINYTFEATNGGMTMSFKSDVTLNLNEEGYVSSGRSNWSEEDFFKSSGSDEWNITYENGYLKNSTGTSKSQEESSTEYVVNYSHDLVWRDGNMVRITGYLNDWVVTATYNTIKVNPLVNVNLNLLMDKLEGWSFIINESHDFDTSFMGFGYYGKTNTNYVATQKDGDEASYEYTLDNNDLVTKITSIRGESEAEACIYEIDYTRVELTE